MLVLVSCSRTMYFNHTLFYNRRITSLMAFENSLGSRFEKPFFGLLPIKLIQLLFSISFSASVLVFSHSFALFMDVSSISASCSKANSFSTMTNTKKPPSTHRPHVTDGCLSFAAETKRRNLNGYV